MRLAYALANHDAPTLPQLATAQGEPAMKPCPASADPAAQVRGSTDLDARHPGQRFPPRRRPPANGWSRPALIHVDSPSGYSSLASSGSPLKSRAASAQRSPILIDLDRRACSRLFPASGADQICAFVPDPDRGGGRTGPGKDVSTSLLPRTPETFAGFAGPGTVDFGQLPFNPRVGGSIPSRRSRGIAKGAHRGGQ